MPVAVFLVLSRYFGNERAERPNCIPNILDRRHMPEIKRHKTAIRRGDASLPVRCSIRDGIITAAETVFDYGCGYGEDINYLSEKGIKSTGWDPIFRPMGERRIADVVNLGYVINVIENPDERSQTLQRAWELCRKALIVSAQIMVSGRGNNQIEFGDGVLTRRCTFQKFYTQAELRAYVETVLETEAFPAAPGIFYAFKDNAIRQGFLTNRYCRRPADSRKRHSKIRFEEHRELLQPLIEQVQRLGRLPKPDEFDLSDQLIANFGSLKRAFAIVRRNSNPQIWIQAAAMRHDDLLVCLALARFRRRPPIRQLPLSLQRDIREFFGSYARACTEADELLFRAGDFRAIDQACRESRIGKLLPNALYVHRSAVESLSPLLRVYEGCGRAFLGELEGVNVIKLHRFSGKVSYLEYREFERDPHPILLRSFKLAMRTQEVTCYEYANSANPPILHRKETFSEPEHPNYAKFSRLTSQEEQRGLLDDSRSIGTKQAWDARLQEAGFVIRGHRLIRPNASASPGRSSSCIVDDVGDPSAQKVQSAVEVGENDVHR